MPMLLGERRPCNGRAINRIVYAIGGNRGGHRSQDNTSPVPRSCLRCRRSRSDDEATTSAAMFSRVGSAPSVAVKDGKGRELPSGTADAGTAAPRTAAARGPAWSSVLWA